MIKAVHFWQEYHQHDAVPFSAHRIRRSVMFLCLLDGDVNHLVKVLSSRFLHYKVTIFPFAISNYLVGRYFETMQISCFPSYPLILASIDDSCLQ